MQVTMTVRTDAKLKATFTSLCEEFGMNANTAMYLYGSYSKGTQRPDSDIDVAVVASEMKGDWFSVVPGLRIGTYSKCFY